jgi:hypothetical protein
VLFGFIYSEVDRPYVFQLTLCGKLFLMTFVEPKEEGFDLFNVLKRHADWRHYSFAPTYSCLHYPADASAVADRCNISRSNYDRARDLAGKVKNRTGIRSGHSGSASATFSALACPHTHERRDPCPQTRHFKSEPDSVPPASLFPFCFFILL